VWQPQRSDAKTNEALDLLDQRKLGAAAKAADDASRIDPLSPDPLLARAAIDDARGDTAAATADLVHAAKKFPGDPEVWERLAEYQLVTLNKPADARQTILAAYYLDPNSRTVQQVFFEASQRMRAPVTLPGAAPTTPPTPTPTTPTKPPGAQAPVPGPAPGPTPGRPVTPKSATK
jgi:hypothetical protein